MKVKQKVTVSERDSQSSVSPTKSRQKEAKTHGTKKKKGSRRYGVEREHVFTF